MRGYRNPFEYEQANKFSSGQILEYFIEDHNYSRFVRSRRNILLVGERGSGKTMTLLYSSDPVQRIKNKDLKPDYSLICIYVPCKTPLHRKSDHELLSELSGTIISEHFFVLSILYEIIQTVEQIPAILDGVDIEGLFDDIEYLLDVELKRSKPMFESLKMAFSKEISKAEKAMNSKNIEVYYENSFSFSSGILPLLLCLKKIPKLKDSHFSLLIDDYHDLNKYQVSCLNSWIAYRDNTFISFKVATTKVNDHSLKTATGGNILPGHDLTIIDMERPYQNKYSDFYKLATDIIKKRLEKIDIKISPEDFIPPDPKYIEGLKRSEEFAREEAKEKYPEGSAKQISDYVFKYKRVNYYRERAKKANLPPYTGFEMLVHLSTGVIRNLLEPCYWMYDAEKSKQNALDGKLAIEYLSPEIQDNVIYNRSNAKWEWIKNKIHNIEGCSLYEAKAIHQLFDNLAILFKKRLQTHESEPRAVTFTVSDQKHPSFDDVNKLLTIARKAQILYTYTSSAKDSGRRETYYIPNRILWPVRGLDPIGQFSRVSIKARHLWAAASTNTQIPYKNVEEDDADLPVQMGLFND